MFARLKNKLYLLEQAMYDARASVELSKLGIPYRPWPGSAIAPAALASILNEIEINRRKTVVEFGCGLSTIYIGKLLNRIGGTLVSFEDNSEWLQLVAQWVGDEGITQQVTMVEAPLAPSRFSVDGLEWYNDDIVRNALSDHSVDCVLVDGPTAFEPGKSMARYAALPALQPHLSERCVVFLDDIRRKGETEILRKWTGEFGMKFKRYPQRGGIAIGTRGPAFYSVM